MDIGAKKLRSVLKEKKSKKFTQKELLEHARYPKNNPKLVLSILKIRSNMKTEVSHFKPKKFVQARCTLPNITNSTFYQETKCEKCN